MILALLVAQIFHLPVTGVFTLPPGIVEISAEIIVPENAHDLEIRGAPSGTTLHATAAFKGRAIFVTHSAAAVRFRDFTIDGNRQTLAKPAGLPAYDVPFARFTRFNGILAEDANGLDMADVRFVNIAGFAVLVSRSRKVRIERCTVRRSGSENARHRNNTTGGILLEEGTADFAVRECALADIRGNGIWTHSLYTSPRNGPGEISANKFADVGRDAIQAGHATRLRIENNTGIRIGFPFDNVDIESQAIPVAIDTAGNTGQCVYANNRFEEIDGNCIDLDGFHDGEVRGNVCVNRQGPEAYKFGGYGMVMNNSNPDMQSRNIRILDNTVDGTMLGGIFVIGSGHQILHNRLERLNLAHCNEQAAQYGCYYAAGNPDMQRSGIYLGKGAERPDAARGNRVEQNRISGFGMAVNCIGSAPGVSRPDNHIADNRCSDR